MNNGRQRLKALMEDNKRVLEMYREELWGMPKGSLYKRTSGSSIYYIKKTKGADGQRKRKGITGSRQVGLLARKKFLQKSIQVIEKDIEVLQKALNRYNGFSFEEIWGGMSNAFSGLAEEMQASVARGSAWEYADYERLVYKEEQKIHRTVRGRKVRSKSEAEIGTLMEMRNIPYRYEMRMELDVGTFYPDFIVKRPADGRVIYWEHFGMMNDPGYAGRTENKLRIYRENGIMQGINLITTYDDVKGGLDGKIITAAIEGYLI